MRKILLFFLLTHSLCSEGQTKNQFSSLVFDKVVIYDFEQAGEDPSLVDNRGEISKGVKIKRKIVLDKTTINELNQRLTNKNSYGNNHADCFDPHLGIVYYFHDKIIGHVLICLDCNRLSSSPYIEAQEQGKSGEGDKAYYDKNGMSKSFRQFLNDLVRKYNFSHQISAGSMFDA